MIKIRKNWYDLRKLTYADYKMLTGLGKAEYNKVRKEAGIVEAPKVEEKVEKKAEKKETKKEAAK